MQHFYVPAKSCARHVLGISGMKKELLTLLACAALLFSGCKQNEPTRQLATTDLVGTWGVSSIQTPLDENEYFCGPFSILPSWVLPLRKCALISVRIQS